MSQLLVKSETTGEKIQLNFNDEVKSRLKSVSQICKHVTVMGKARTGKSFLLNAIAGQNSMFEVGNESVVTKGVHISNEILKLDGECSVRMIDVEGMGDKGDHYDYPLALPVLAASDLILFNFKGQQRKNDVIKELSLLVHIFKRVLENQSNQEAINEQKSKYLFPPIILVLRDWTHAKSFTPEKYLGEIFDSEDSSVQEIRRCVKTIDVCYLPPPADHITIRDNAELPLKSMNEDFTQELDGLKRQMAKYLRQSTSTLLASRSSTTEAFLNIVKQVCDQLNGSGFRIPDIMDAIVRYELSLAVDTILDDIETKYATQLPMAKEELKKRMDKKLEEALTRFREVTQHLSSARHKKMREEEEGNLKKSIQQGSEEKVRENHDLIVQELLKEAGRLLDRFRAYMSQIRDSTSDLLAVKREAEKQKDLFVEGLVDVARKKNFLGAAVKDKIDEKTARKLLPIANHLKEFDSHASSEMQECEIQILRANGTKSEAELKTVKAEAEKQKRNAEKGEKDRKKLEKELKERQSERENERRVIIMYAGGMSGGMGGGWNPCGSSMGFPGDMMGGGMPNFDGYPAIQGPSSHQSFGMSGSPASTGRVFPGTPTGGFTPTGRELFQGPRGGTFHVSSGGYRVYH